MDNKLKTFRKEHNLTQQKMASILGCSYRNIQNWEGGQAKLPEWEEKVILFYLNTMITAMGEK